MLPKEVVGPLTDIQKKNPVLALLLTLLIIVSVALYWDNKRGGSSEAQRCRESEAKAWAMFARERAEKDSIIKENNRELREQIIKNEMRKASQDSAIQAFNKITQK